MMDIERLVFLYLTINSIKTISLVSMRELEKIDIIIDINKGYALRRIGTGNVPNKNRFFRGFNSFVFLTLFFGKKMFFLHF